MKITEFLSNSGVAFECIPHRATYDAQRMAQALHVPGKEVAKTVLLRDPQHTEFVVAVLPATKQVDFGRAAQAAGKLCLELASEKEIAAHCPDCEVGALPPFGSRYGMATLVENTLRDDEEIVFESNTHHEAIRMRLNDYLNIEQPRLASFAR